MSLTLYFHPFSSFCQKVLIALYENATPFDGRLIDLGHPDGRAELAALWPLVKFPVLHDDARQRTVAESSIIIEYLQEQHPGPVRLLPDDPGTALAARFWDRFYDLHVQVPMQKVVSDRLRPAGTRDPYGVDAAKAALRTAYDIAEAGLTGGFAVGEQFTIADCAAAPALFYADLVVPFRESHPGLAAYFDRLLARPSFARAVEEASPYRSYFPQ
jgi:glutathione S-transferase